ncbi:Uncharacterized protein FWK35_00013366 [Aphis craccivora]|uniref:SP-RING-type domain-containing protein n=1 Tax=Aphis craccivora TaxID=307492 RepID=A0A6G0ZDC6_APHCR|nr:Uncharacterized protein FWK35_00013366 [Aphis craccivora]
MRIKIPVKSIHCDHLQCFDASKFILMNEKKPTWMCPIYDNPYLYDDLQIENYFLEIVSSKILKNWSKKIEILADGTWRVFKETKKNQYYSDKVKPINYVDLDNDNEKCIEPRTEPSLESCRTQQLNPNIDNNITINWTSDRKNYVCAFGPAEMAASARCRELQRCID